MDEGAIVEYDPQWDEISSIEVEHKSFGKGEITGIRMQKTSLIVDIIFKNEDIIKPFLFPNCFVSDSFFIPNKQINAFIKTHFVFGKDGTNKRIDGINDELLICQTCGNEFVYTKSQRIIDYKYGYAIPTICKICKETFRREKEIREIKALMKNPMKKKTKKKQIHETDGMHLI